MEDSQPGASVWGLILSHCPEEEASEVRRVLGESLVEQAIDLREEVSTLLDIERQLKNEETVEHLSTLAEPPQVRDRLIGEILLLVDYLKTKQNFHLLDQDSNQGLLKYVERQNPRSKQSSQCDVVAGRTHNDDVPSTSQSGSEVSLIDCDVKQFSSSGIDSVVDNLRQALREECSQLQKQVEYLQCRLVGEQSEANPTEPTIKELREFGTQLEHAMLEDPPSLPSEPTKSLLPPLATHKQPRPPSKLHTGVMAVTRASRVKKRQTTCAGTP